MAHSYTPGLSVKRHTVIERERRLPLRGTVLKAVGDPVAATDLVARTELPGNIRVVNAANTLGVPPADLLDLMRAKAQAPITEGQLLAESSGLFGLFKSRVTSPLTGTLESVSSVTGQLMLREPPVPVELSAYITGVIAEVYAGEGVLIRTEGALIQGIFGIGGERNGVIQMVVSSPEDALTPELLDPSHAGCIVVGGSLLTAAGWQRACALGVAALVVGGYPFADLRTILGYDVGVAITGTEDIPTALILTEGFGHIAMAGRTFDLLGACAGRVASVNGATQIRAGVIRPEIIIPSDARAPATGEEAPSLAGGLTIGNQVRVIRNPAFGRIGTVTRLPDQLEQLDTGAMVRVLEVSFADGDRAVVPRANVEVIQA